MPALPTRKKNQLAIGSFLFSLRVSPSINPHNLTDLQRLRKSRCFPRSGPLRRLRAILQHPCGVREVPRPHQVDAWPWVSDGFRRGVAGCGGQNALVFLFCGGWCTPTNTSHGHGAPLARRTKWSGSESECTFGPRVGKLPFFVGHWNMEKRCCCRQITMVFRCLVPLV